MSSRDRIRQVVERWFLIEPLLFAAWTIHHLLVEPRVRTVRVRAGRIEYNPEFIDSLNRQSLEAVLRAEATRILLKHPYQRRKENAIFSYTASNITLKEFLTIELPFSSAQSVFGTNAYDQQYFEFYYNKLQEIADHSARITLNGGQGAVQHQAPDDKSLSLLEQYSNAELIGGENTDGWNIDDMLTDRIDDTIRRAQESNQWGSIAGHMRDQILASLYPKLDYRSILRSFRTSILANTRVLTRMKPSRRYGFLYLGSRYDLATRLLFAVDVSGSIGDDDLERGFSVMNRFFNHGVPVLDVIQFDTEIHGKPLTLKKARHVINIEGRGGTSFDQIISYIDEYPNYDGLIIFTDGCAPIPKRPKNLHTRILWLFNNESSYLTMHNALRHIGRAVYLK